MTLATAKLTKVFGSWDYLYMCQLAGGTNSYTVTKLQSTGLLKRKVKDSGTRTREI